MPKSGSRIVQGLALRVCPLKFASLLFVLALLPAFSQSTTDPDPTKPLPQDSGVAGLKEMLLRLHTTARLLHTTAHPDDEDGAMLTL